MKNLYTIVAVLLSMFTVPDLIAQPCSSLVISAALPTESRCMATGTISVTVGGGSGNYNYKVTGPISTPFTTSAVITGLIAGTYSVSVQDVNTSCTVTKNNVVVTGSYIDPRFTVSKSDETCLNLSDGTITLSSLSGGRAPYTFTIVAPSPFGVGTSNNTGIFTGLTGGDYSIELKDSCGGIQTRRITLLGYDWWIASYTASRINCADAQFNLRLQDSRGNTNSSGTSFNGYQYGVVNAPGDTSWYSTANFTHTIGTDRSVILVAKDLCGNAKRVTWVNNVIPTVGNIVAISSQSCNSFTASINGQANLSNPTYCLYTLSGTQLSCNASGSFSGITVGEYYITIQDLCYDTIIRRNFTANLLQPSADASAAITPVSCSNFNAAITGLVNFTNPQFCIYNASGTQLNCNSTGVFNSLANGSYCIQIKDGCYDTTVVRCFTVTAPIPSAAANVTISDESCSDFDVNIIGRINLTNANYCLYTSAGVLVACNGTGNFNNLNYGAYCMRITADANCYDTTIERCFQVLPVRPSGSVYLDVTKTCSSITISAAGLSGFDNPQFCLYDDQNILISCNTTGIFPGIPYGSYCMDIRNNAVCFDTTVRRCITVIPDIPAIGSVQIQNQICSGFDVNVSGKTFLTNPVFSLKNSAGIVIATNTTGDFNSIPYGDYCIDMQNDATCYDTLITRCFTVTLPVPDAGTAIVTGRTCSGFTATLTWINNFSSPAFSLLDNSGAVVATNTTGLFTNVPFGDYCISITDVCYDTTITRCVTGAPRILSITAIASASCELNATNLRINITNGQSPYTARVYDHLNNLVATVPGSSSPIRVFDLPALPPSQRYRVELTDNCGNVGTAMVTPILSTFNSNLTMVAKCPSGTYQNGSSELTIVVSSNLGTIRPVIIKKDGATVNILYNTSTTTIYKWIDLEPANYIIQYNLPGSCNNKAFDTVAVGPYQFPQLDKSASYQCDNNSFSVSAGVNGGAPPFTFEIIGSVPAAPSIIAPPQASPMFNISNGNIYSLVRLRAVDYCGNATLNDVSVLPLQNMVISSSNNCFYSNVLLSVDTIPNASYSWYFKTSATDSILVGTNRTYEMPYLMPSDIGTYVSRVNVNGGCLIRLSYFAVTGDCGTVLPGKLTLTGKEMGGKQYLSWNHLNIGIISSYLVERRLEGTDQFVTIGQTTVNQGSNPAQFAYTDEPGKIGNAEYRIRAVDQSGHQVYSNIILIKNQANLLIQVFPNPVQQQVNIRLQSPLRSDYSLQLFTAGGQLLYAKQVNGITAGVITIKREPSMKPGMYFLRIRQVKGGIERVEKLVME